MKKRYQIPVALFVLIGGFGGMKLIAAAGEEETQKEAVDTRPTVSVSKLAPVDYTVEIESFGAVAPMERTMLAAQVSGEIVSWHEDFIPGGIIQRGEVLFSIEKDAYEAAVLLAEANLQRARADLIQEQAQSKVAENEAKRLNKTAVSDLYLRKPQLMSAQAAVKSAEAQLRIAQRDLDNCDVRAPYDALVVTKNIGVGDFVSMGSPTAELNNIEMAEITIPIAGFDSIFVGSDSQSRQATIVQSNGQRHEGEIHRDLGIIDEQTRMAHFVVRVADPYALDKNTRPLKFGSYVTVKFNGITLENVYSIPQELVNKGKLWMVDDEGKLISHNVTVLREAGANFMIKADEQINRPVVNTLPEYPREGMKVKVASKVKSSESDNQALIVRSDK